VIPTVREILRRRVSPRSYQQIRFCWWQSSFWLPRLVASSVVRRNPRIQRGGVCELANQLRSINVFAPTEMCRVMTKFGSDKGHGYHNYTAIYSALLGNLRDRPLRIFELGLGTNNPTLASTMGTHGLPGASLRAWRELFPHALIFGADIDRYILFEEDRIKTFYCDQLDSAAIRDLWSQPALKTGFDVIIDDGLHTFEANASFLDGSLEQLRPGGIFVIEDITREAIPRWLQLLETYAKRFPSHQFVLVDLPNFFNSWDNNLLVIRGEANQSALGC